MEPHKLVVSLAAVLFLGSSALIIHGTYESSPRRKIVFEPQRLELSSVRQNETIPFKLRLRNLATKEVEVTQVVATCHCTRLTGIERGTVIGPNGEADLSLEFETGKADGAVRSLVFVEARCGDEAVTTQLEVTGIVEPEYRLTPGFIDFGEVASDTAMPVRLDPIMDKDVSIVKAECFGADFMVDSFGGHDRPVRDLVIRFRPVRTASPGSKTGSLVVHTSSPRMPKYEVALRAAFRPSFELEPPSVVISESETKQHLRLRSTNGTEFKVISCRPSSDAVNCRWDSSRTATAHAITIFLNAQHRLITSEPLQIEIFVVSSQKNVAGKDTTSLVVPVSVLLDSPVTR